MYYDKYGGVLNEETQEKWRLDDNGTIYAICPKCKEKIYGLDITLKAYVDYVATPNGTNELDYEEFEKETDWDDDYNFHCPKCGEIIARSEDEAVKLFRE